MDNLIAKFTDDVDKAEIAPLHAISLTSHLLKLYQSGVATDVNVNCEGETFKLHACVLLHSSAYFRRVLADEESDIDLEFMPAIESSSFRIVVESLYTGVVRGINEDNVTSLLEAGHHLEIPHVSVACEHYMIQRLDLENCLAYWLSAKLCESDKVKTKAIGLIGRHLQKLSRNESFLGLHSNTMLEILGDDELQIPSEHFVYEAAIAWIKYEEENRSEYLSDLLEAVRLSYLPVHYLVNIVGKEDLIEDDPKAMSKYSKALKLKLGNNTADVKKRHNLIFAVQGNFEKVKKSASDSDCHKKGNIDRPFSFCMPKNIIEQNQSEEENENTETDEQDRAPIFEKTINFLQKSFSKKKEDDDVMTGVWSSVPIDTDPIDTVPVENISIETEPNLEELVHSDSYASQHLEDVIEGSDEDCVSEARSGSKIGISYSEEHQDQLINLDFHSNSDDGRDDIHGFDSFEA